jgi:uracil-DNA glycosylase
MKWGDDTKIVDSVLSTEWKTTFEPVKDQINDIQEAVEDQYINTFEKELEIFPPKNLVFNAFHHCKMQNVKIVILGQDCYHGENQANGMCFAVSKTVKNPPSLVNILVELKSEYPDMKDEEISSELVHWSDQGILLLNTALTVLQGSPNKHAKLWKKVTDHIIKDVSEQCPDVIFILWGKFAQGKAKLIKNHNDSKGNTRILKCNHPSPLSANRGGWWDNGHFKEANRLLELQGKEPINWFKNL